jgi:uncharacterized RDD family membrane protein YckC
MTEDTGTVVAPIPANAFIPCGNQKRPWVRLAARYIDLLTFATLVGGVAGVAYAPMLEINNVLFSMITLLVYVFVEPCMLSSWGTTPGKAMLNIHLRKTDGTKPAYAEALSRSFNVWVRGLGLGIPVVSLATCITSYKTLMREGETSWDKDGGFRIAHGNVGAGRVIAVIAFFFGFILLAALCASP